MVAGYASLQESVAENGFVVIETIVPNIVVEALSDALVRSSAVIVQGFVNLTWECRR